MQQHPVPQNVTQYQFRLVGDMTLKQFLELAGGLLLAYLFFASNLIFIFKWPLIILSILFGVGLAFFPIEDRPLDQWIVNFIKAIYSPTRFIWKKSDKVPRMFTFTPHAVAPTTTITKTIKAPTRMTTNSKVSDLSDLEAQKIASLSSLFATTPAPPLESGITGKRESEIAIKPTVTVRKLKPQTTNSAALPRREIKIEPAIPIKVDKQANAPAQAQIKENVVFTSKPSVATTQTTQTQTAPLKTINLPSSPKIPGIVVGVVVDKDGKLLEGSIVELVSADGIPQRAMKTNALGQFYTATPLSQGSYTIHIEKDGHTFAPQNLNIGGSIIAPFELRATS